MASLLEFKNVSKKFGSITALQEISFNIDEGEFVFISGHSGAGKTTFIRLILREFIPDTGEIILEGKDITKLPKRKIPELRQNIGVIFQDFKVLPERTIWENIAVALAVVSLPEKEWKPRIEHVLKLVGLMDRADLFPSQLSGGELQRAAMARALVVNPKIILADEPTGNLDWETADMLMELFEKINEEGKTIIMATHNKMIIDRMKKRVIELKQGQVIEDRSNKKMKKDKDKDD